MYEAIPAVPLFPPADGLAGVGKVRAPVLQPTPWLQLRRETTSVPIKQIDKFPQVAKAADAVIMWCIHEALKRVQTGNENSAGLTGAVQILRQSVDLREHIRKKQEEALASFNALIETASKEFSGVDIRLFRFWGMAANLKGQPNEPDDMYVESMEQTRWLLSNALLRATGQLSGETVDSKLVDCEHLTYTAYSSKLRKIFTLKESKTRFCSISVTGWILFGARQLFDIAKSASESGDGEATATLVSIQEAIKKFEGVKEDLEQLWPVFEEYRSTVLSWLPKPETTAEAEK
ncbi:conserved hypothetical protein [Neospora caninum Liverpool]|nr:conserved hypothetical protein [Neospora caninum Liverpool]CBZ49873.1 conserved hypothetical protein [Neospora caninum Liverpool]|eukprot:XP_003879908.1 conserved hypothetical protein [Neospora caninum Liverpool]